MNLSPRNLIKLQEMHDFLYKRTKGSRQIYFNPISNKTIIVPIQGGRVLKKETFLAILKQAEIDKKELE
ncbi:MAG: type II toxin-antitoxin system HicA family toxin [Bacteroidota bacterium]|nr:type II toxin-antitoxin system HicA family toxin [Bacteroidota bacterium]